MFVPQKVPIWQIGNKIKFIDALNDSENPKASVIAGNHPICGASLKLELRGHFILVQFHSECDAAYSHVGAIVVVSP